MNVVNVGGTFKIYNDHLKVYDKLPAASYVVRFDKMQGFFLESHSDMEIHEDKVYGAHLSKVDKCLNSFCKTNRNLGVILSGAKGIGKSLFAKLLGRASVEKGYPLIIVDKFIPDIASFIEEIDQEVVVLFDEFDKTFDNIKVGDNEASPQSALLTLFDGVAAGKKLYVVTCNELRGLNDYLVNRPGRFHYHFRFEYPEADEIREYLQDKLDSEYWSEIPSIIAFSRKTNLNYDCLRAIASEIQNGETFVSAIKDLNIVNTETSRFDLILHFKNGSSMKRRNIELDMFGESDYQEDIWMRDNRGNTPICVLFFPTDAVYDVISGSSIISNDKLELSYDEDEVDDIEDIKALTVDRLEIRRAARRGIHYDV